MWVLRCRNLFLARPNQHRVVICDVAFSFVEEAAKYNTVKAGIRCTARKTVTNSSAPEHMLGAVVFNFDKFNEEPELTIQLECEPINAPVGEARRKYGRIWNAFSYSIMCGIGSLGVETDPDPSNLERSEAHYKEYEAYLKSTGLRLETRITPDNLNNIFGGLIRDWDYLFKVLNVLQNAKFAKEMGYVFTYSCEEDGSVIVRLNSVFKKLCPVFFLL